MRVVQDRVRLKPRNAFSPARSIGLAIAISGHLSLLMLLLRAPAPAEPGEETPQQPMSDAMVARLIPRAPADASPEPPLARDRPITRPVQRRTISPPKPETLAPAIAREPQRQILPAGDAPAYVPGGRDFAIVRSTGTSPPRLPGGATVRGAPRLHMVDPQWQGVSVIVRAIGSLTGAADPACVKADALAAMSEEERIARHTTGADMQRIAIEHNCPLPPSQKGRQ
jgi:hypothetical protein